MPDELGADAVALVRGENAERRKHVDVDEPPQRIEPARGEHPCPVTSPSTVATNDNGGSGAFAIRNPSTRRATCP